MYKFVVVILVAISQSAFAQYFTPLNGPGVEISKVFSHTGGAISLIIEGAVENRDGCTGVSRVYIPADLVGHQVMVSTALMAFASGKKIGLYASACKTTEFWGGEVDVAIVNNLWVFK